MDDDGPSHPQAGVGVRRGQHQALRLALRHPTQADLLTRLPAGVPQLGAGQHPSGPPGKGQEVVRTDFHSTGPPPEKKSCKCSAFGLINPSSLRISSPLKGRRLTCSQQLLVSCATANVCWRRSTTSIHVLSPPRACKLQRGCIPNTACVCTYIIHAAAPRLQARS